jgi:hypothetical protein
VTKGGHSHQSLTEIQIKFKTHWCVTKPPRFITVAMPVMFRGMAAKPLTVSFWGGDEG